MSSHHFVREGQEPALCIINPISFSIISSLLEWAPLVLVSQDVVEEVLQWGIKIDVVIGNPKSAVEVLPHHGQGAVEILTCQPGETIAGSAMQYLESKQQKGVNITAADFATTCDLVSPFQGRLQISVLDDSVRWSAVSSGVFEKWLPALTTLSVWESHPTQTTQFQGLTRNDHGWVTDKNGMIRISSRQLFWVGEPHARLAG